MARERQLIDKVEALKLASLIGCSGAHQGEGGGWMPCSSHEEMIRVSNRAEKYVPKKMKADPASDKERTKGRRKRRRKREFEKLGEAGISAIQSIDAGLVAGPPGSMITGKAANIGPEYVRETDPDVFLDPQSARARSRQLGCIGISRRISKTGRAVWMPCTNMSDYARLSGSTALGRKRKREMERQSVRTVLTDILKRRGRKSIAEQLGYRNK